MTTKKLFSAFLTAFSLCVTGHVIAGSGPSKPEAAQFEPIDVSDMVNLFSGDFSYSVPLLEVPGPEGNWPVNIAYHAGIGPNTDQTWVGLGWTLNPGAINRFPSGFADDWYGGMTTSLYKESGGRTKGYGLGFGWGPFGMNAQFVDGKGLTGISGSLRVLGALALIPGFSALENSPFDVSLSGGTGQGFSASMTLSGGTKLGSSGLALGGSLSFNSDGSVGGGLGLTSSAYGGTNSLSLAGVSFASNQQGGSFSLAGTGFSSGTSGPSGGYKSKSSSWGFSVPLPGGFDISLSGYEVKWWLYEVNAEGGFGVLHQGGYQGNHVKDYWYQSGTASYKTQYELSSINLQQEEINESANSANSYNGTNRFDRITGKDYQLPGEDIYSVSAMGVSGAFKPHFEYPFELNDGANQNEKGRFNLIDAKYNKKQNIQFRYLNDPGTNYIMNSGSLNATTYTNLFNKSYQSKYIIPTMDQESGLIVGFTIIAEDGKIYEFMKAVKNYVTSNMYKKDNFYSQQDVYSPYATSWLLTAVKGPDYIDQNNDGEVNSGDLGFWFRFTYKDEEEILWRTPALPGTTTPLAENATQWSWGIRDNTNLESIESETHKAVFYTKNDGKHTESLGLESNIDINAGSILGTADRVNHIAKFAISKRLIKHLIEKYNVKLILSYNVEDDNKRHLKGEINSELLMNSVLNKYGVKLYSQSLYYNQDRGYYRDYDLPTFSTTGSAFATDNVLGANEPLEVLLDWDPDYTDLDQAKLTIVTTDNKSIIQTKDISGTKIWKKYLDKIVVYNKYANTSNPQITNGVKFGYAYQLKSGLLTLKSLQFFGINEKSLIPSTSFEYSSFNPQFNTHSYDFWNHYSSVANDTTHKNSQDPVIANRDASAWNLTTINTPLGSKIQITYESDQIQTVGVSGLPSNSSTLVTPPTNLVTNVVTLSESVIGFSIGDKVRLLDHYTYWGYVEYIDYDLEENPINKSYYTPKESVEEIGEAVILSIAGSQISLSKSFNLLMNNFEEDTTGRQHSYKLQNLSNVLYQGTTAAGGLFYGGGHRVKRIDLNSGFQSTYQNYEYGPGVTPCLPSGLKKSYPDYPDKIFLDDDFNQIGPSPGVGYEWVTVTTRDLQGNVLNGRIRTSFYTAKDAKYAKNSSTSGGVTKITINDLSGIIGRQKKIEEFAQKEKSSGLTEADYYLTSETQFDYRYSSLREQENGTTKSLVFDSDGNTRKIILGKSESNQYTFLSDTTKPLGLTSQTVRSVNIDSTKIVTVNRQNVYMVGTTTTKYTYNRAGQPVGAPFTVKTKILGFDARTGNSLITIAWDSRNRQLVSESYPAYLFYDGMKTNNMMTQPGLTKGYLLPESVNYWSIAGTSSIKQYLKSSELTTWKDWNSDPEKSVWRQNDKYKAISIGSNFSEPPASIFGLSDESASPANFDYVSGWQRTSNITRYDLYGHPIEERGLDGNYTSSVYGYANSLPLAIATNARHYSAVSGMGNEFSSGDFEDIQTVNGNRASDYFKLYSEPSNHLVTTDPHSGRYCVYVSPNNGGYAYSPGGDFLPEDQTRKFMVSCWVKTETGFGNNGQLKLVIHSANPSLPGTHYPAQGVYVPVPDTDGKWKFVSSFLDLGAIRKQYGIPAGEKLSIRVFMEHQHPTKGVYIDDFRFHPVDAAVSSFTYDPVTWKVTSISDQSSLISYFEYDEIGRLTVVRDQNKNIINLYHYNYGKMTR